MAEVPQHLLERSRARRAALGGGGDDDVAPGAAPGQAPAAAPVAAASTAVTAAPASKAVAPAKGTVASPPVVPVAPPPPRIPVWAMSVLMLFPFWGLFYIGTFIKDTGKVEKPEQIGGRLFAQCQACHNANGSGSDGGGIGRPLWKGEVEKTFLKSPEQIAFIRHGSCEKGTPYGNPNRPGGQHEAKGGMPAFGESQVSDEQIAYLVDYERNNLSGKAFPTTTIGKGPTTVPTTIDPAKICG